MERRILSISCIVLFLGHAANSKSFAPQPSVRNILVPTLPPLQLNGTEFVDKVMESVRKQVKESGLDVINPPDINLNAFNRSISIYNQTIVGLANAYRVGDVIVTTTLFSTKFRSAFAVYNVSSDTDVRINLKNMNYDDGHIHMDCDNVTAYQVFKFAHFTQTVTLDEFELSVGDCKYNATGLGELAQNGSTIA